MKHSARWLSWCLAALLLATGDGVWPHAPVRADDQVDQEKAMIQQMEDQFGPQIRQLQKIELHFLRGVCQPTKEQFGKIATDAEPGVKAAIKSLAESMTGRRRPQPNNQQALEPRRAITEGLLTAARTHLTADQVQRYQKEIELRAAATKRLALLNLVAELDARLLLTKDQRGALGKVLEKNWNDNWNNLQLVQHVAQYMPQVPDAEILPLLNDKQKEVWRGIPKNNVQFGFNFGFGMVQDVEIEDVQVVEEGAGKPVEKP